MLNRRGFLRLGVLGGSAALLNLRFAGAGARGAHDDGAVRGRCAWRFQILGCTARFPICLPPAELHPIDRGEAGCSWPRNADELGAALGHRAAVPVAI